MKKRSGQNQSTFHISLEWGYWTLAIKLHFTWHYLPICIWRVTEKWNTLYSKSKCDSPKSKIKCNLLKTNTSLTKNQIHLTQNQRISYSKSKFVFPIFEKLPRLRHFFLKFQWITTRKTSRYFWRIVYYTMNL